MTSIFTVLIKYILVCGNFNNFLKSSFLIILSKSFFTYINSLFYIKFMKHKKNNTNNYELNKSNKRLT